MEIVAPARRRVGAPSLDPRLDVLVRPDGRIQLGWSPERAILVAPPHGATPTGFADFLRTIDGARTRPQLVWDAARLGFDPRATARLLDVLTRAGALLAPAPPRECPTVRVHGRGPLSDAIAAALTATGTIVSRSTRYPIDRDARRWRERCVVLTDASVVDPRLVHDLVAAGIPHLHVRLRDGGGLVGPFVLPGRTACLRCVELVRAELDTGWPHLAAQLVDRSGRATPPVVTTTVAVALAQLDLAFRGAADRPPASFDATLEIDDGGQRIDTRHWARRDDCSCAWARALPGRSHALSDQSIGTFSPP
ncbi:hypothetical protein [Rhodococcus rhodnii]|uniref:Bacteriocin biosynthesis cyclodehydratase domain-containing protein n=1 Tax=Rhodococcus rhodnii LMG 5362 TaxID=1273125 RepID=R7WTG9_9NOCA|nr:hypothetical protein [Rhodococcus rhodnii]EOM77429.1 hypothetical protein Rrhod_1236 [Rhodococcus rhodnii LMG 5362]